MHKPRSCFTSDGKPKRRFDTRADAKKWERDLREKYPNNKPLEPYRCDFCQYFHLGTYPSDPEAREGKRKKHHPEMNGSRPVAVWMDEVAGGPSLPPENEGPPQPLEGTYSQPRGNGPAVPDVSEYTDPRNAIR